MKIIKYLPIIDNRKKSNCDIIIRVRNELESIQRLIDEIKLQQDVSCNIIVLDTDSTDGTREFLEKVQDITLYSVTKENFNYGDSLDFLISQCISGVVFSFSAHISLNNSVFLVSVIDALTKNNDIVAGYFRQIPSIYTGCSSFEQVFLKYNFPKTKSICPISREFGKIKFSNAGAVFQRSIVTKYKFGGFNGSEDKIWAFSLMKLDQNIVYFGNLSIMHSHEETLDQLEKRIYINYREQIKFSKIKISPIYTYIKYLIGLLLLLPFGDKCMARKYAKTAYKASRKAIKYAK